MRKSILEKRLKRLIAKKAELTERCNAAESAAEVRKLTKELEEKNDEIAETQEELEAIEAEEKRMAESVATIETREGVPANAKLVNGTAKASFTMPTQSEQRGDVNPRETMEYRQAFRKYMTSGVMAPELRAGNAISTDDSGAAIPVTIMNEVINTIRVRYGSLYNKVRKTAVKGGVGYPVGALEASFSWVDESTVSPRKKVGKLGRVFFNSHVAELRVAQTFLSDLLTMDAFEAEIARVIAIAYLKAMDEAIVNGTGDGMPLGILNDTRITDEGHVIEMTDADFSDWSAWLTKVFGIIPMGYADVELIMTKGTVYSKLRTMKDDVNRPIYYEAMGGRVEDTDYANPRAYLDGHEISLVEPTILPNFDTASEGDVVAIVWIPFDYAVNENFGFAMRRYYDDETNEWVDKALTVVDGKILNPGGYYLIKKKAS